MKMSSILHREIHIKGQVQGVGFRYSCLRIAKSLGVKGFVRNEPDGSVYIEAEGTEIQLKSFIDWCRQGPRYAMIENVLVNEGVIKGFSQFSINQN